MSPCNLLKLLFPVRSVIKNEKHSRCLCRRCNSGVITANIKTSARLHGCHMPLTLSSRQNSTNFNFHFKIQVSLDGTLHQLSHLAGSIERSLVAPKANQRPFTFMKVSESQIRKVYIYYIHQTHSRISLLITFSTTFIQD